MGLALRSLYAILLVTVLLSAPCHGQDAYVCSRATYYGSPDCLGTPTGACGYREYGRVVNGGDVSGASRLYRNGTGCGACYQVRCKGAPCCSEEGVKVVVTDYGEGDRTDFILSTHAYANLARPGFALELFAYGVVDIEYKRIPCQYPGYNLLFKVHEHSRFPDYLAIVILYQAGTYDTVALEVWQEDCKQWRPMRRAYGTVWDMPNPPKGALRFRIKVIRSDEAKWVQPSNPVLTSEWKAGVAYDTTIQLT
ncbi:hypothetical protein RJ640_012939 [Escallonia rubra]|uniref:Expansin-like B1 n=1 Tax=Escallonia rubra TaxID=112253 RepID=A0AA88UJS0_9ASTE|nr:hypothetical protein RJ640_012939 [Escallonia rubra]